MARYNSTGPESLRNNENCQKTMENRTRLEAQRKTILGIGAQFEDAHGATVDNTNPYLEENGATTGSIFNRTQSSNSGQDSPHRDPLDILDGIRWRLDWQRDIKAFPTKTQGNQAHSNSLTSCDSIHEKCSSSVDVWSKTDAGPNYILHASGLPTIGQDMNQTHVDNMPRSVCFLFSAILALVPEEDTQLQRWMQRLERHEIIAVWLSEIHPIATTMVDHGGRQMPSARGSACDAEKLEAV